MTEARIQDISPRDITHGRVWAISWPIILSNSTVPLLGAFDTAIVGQMGEARLIGAVGLGSVILASLYWLFGFLRMGTSGFTAQAHGAGDQAETAAILYRALLVGFGAGAMLVLAQIPLFWAAFWLAPASPEVEATASAYLQIRIWGAPATIALYAINGWMIAREQTRAVLWLQIWINGINAVLNLWLVLGLGFGVQGVATATLIAEWSGLTLGLWLCRDAFGPIAKAAWARIGNSTALQRMVAVNSAIMLRSVLLQGAFTGFLFLSSGLGDVELASNQVLLQFLSITAHALDGFSFAAETLVGQAIGQRRARDVSRAVRLSFQWGIGGAVLLSLVYAIAGPWLVDLMTTAPDVRAEARNFLPWVALAPVLGIASWIYDGVFIGATQARAMLVVVGVSVALYVVSLLILLPLLGNHGLWASLMVMNVARGITAWRLWPKLHRAIIAL